MPGKKIKALTIFNQQLMCKTFKELQLMPKMCRPLNRLPMSMPLNRLPMSRHKHLNRLPMSRHRHLNRLPMSRHRHLNRLLMSRHLNQRLLAKHPKEVQLMCNMSRHLNQRLRSRHL
jgi:hypothetical protein